MAANSDSAGRTPNEAPPPRRRRPWRAYFILALLVVTVGSILYARVVARRAHALNAENATKIEWVTGYLAGKAADHAAQARSAVVRRNWGTAQDALAQCADAIGALEQVAPRESRDRVAGAREALQRAQTAVGAGKDADASKAIDNLTRILGPLSPE